MTAPDSRLAALRAWLQQLPPHLGLDTDSLRPASTDASFRRYFRLDTAHGTRVVMDAPPDTEPLDAFLDIAERLRRADVKVPEVLARDVNQGLLLLSDLGETNFQAALHQAPMPDDATVHQWYLGSLQALAAVQHANADGLPAYDAARLTAELQLFPEWYIDRHCGHALDNTEREQLAIIGELLARRAAAQPQVLVHRDFHSPNLMLPVGDDPRPGVIDFQDAVRGPIAYDLASLLMDARTTWDEPQQLDWGIRYWELARRQGLPVPADIAEFHVDWEWIGLQRNLRILGVFARLNLRDGKPGYLAHLPRVEGYVRQVAEHYDVFRPLLRLLDRLAERGAKDDPGVAPTSP